MPIIPASDSSTKVRKVWNDLYSSHPVTIEAMDIVLKANPRRGKGDNGASILARIDYMKRAMNCGLVHPENMRRAQATISNLEGQLCEEQ